MHEARLNSGRGKASRPIYVSDGIRTTILHHVLSLDLIYIRTCHSDFTDMFIDINA